MRDSYTIMKTDFARCKTSVFICIPIARYGTSTGAWNATMEEIHKQNSISDGKAFYWVKYK